VKHNKWDHKCLEGQATKPPDEKHEKTTRGGGKPLDGKGLKKEWGGEGGERGKKDGKAGQGGGDQVGGGTLLEKYVPEQRGKGQKRQPGVFESLLLAGRGRTGSPAPELGPKIARRLDYIKKFWDRRRQKITGGRS